MPNMDRKPAPRRLRQVAILLLFVSLASCGGLISSALLAKSISEDRGRFISSELLLDTFSAKVYKVVYSSIDQNGNQVNASGIVGLPVLAHPAGIISYQHGTISKNSDAPSNSVGTLTESILAPVIGSGLILVMADYLGFGESAGLFHPYHHAGLTASGCIDLLRATKTFLQNRGTDYGGKLFLVGYSEGGYATLALQKEIEQNAVSEFSLTAVLAGAGAYDMPTTAHTIVAEDNLEDPAYVLYLLLAYDSVYGWNRSADKYFNEPYAAEGPPMFNGDYAVGDINQILTSVTADLFNPAFRARFLAGSETALDNAFAENDLTKGWAPSAPTRLFHGVSDRTVPYANSQTAYTNFIANGSPDLELVTCTTGAANHEDCAAPFALYAIGFITGYL